MFRCKAYSSKVPNASERRSLQVETSANVRDTLEQLLHSWLPRICGQATLLQWLAVRFQEVFCASGEVQPPSDGLERSAQSITDNISVVLSVFPLETQQASSGSEQQLYPLLQEVNVRPPKRPARQSAAPQSKRTCLFSFSPTLC